jgi:hypothetical protein
MTKTDNIRLEPTTRRATRRPFPSEPRSPGCILEKVSGTGAACGALVWEENDSARIGETRAPSSRSRSPDYRS